MLEAYFDESGIQNNGKPAPICIIAGYCGGQLDWRRFENRWKRILESVGIEEFHSNRFWGRDKDGKRVKPFENWNDQQAEALLDRLINVIVQYGPYPIAHGIAVADWNALDITDRRYLSGGNPRKEGSGSPNKPYFLPFQHCLIDAKNMCRPQDTVHYFVGLDRTFFGYAKDFFKRIKDFPLLRNRQAMGGFGASPAKDTPGIQAADLLAYRLFQSNLGVLKAGKAYDDPILGRILRHRRPNQRFDLLRTADFVRIICSAKQIYEDYRAKGLIKHGKERPSKG